MSKSWLVPILAVVLTCWRVGPASAAEEKEQDEQKVAFKHAPSAVRKTLKREANGQKIKTVDKERLNGKLVYEADVMIDGHNYEIVVDPDGLLLSKKLDNEEDEKAESGEASKEHRKGAESAKHREDDSDRDNAPATKREKEDKN